MCVRTSIVRLSARDVPAHILERARCRHRRHARSDLVQFESLRQQTYSFLPDLENPFSAKLCASSAWRAEHVVAPAIVGRIVRDAIAGAHRVLRSFVDGLANLDHVVEDGWVD